MNSVKSRYAKTIAWLAVLIWMGVIFCFSSQAGEVSGKASKDISKAVAAAVYENPTPKVIEKIDNHVRDSAHCTVYTALGLLVMLALSLTGVGKRKILLAIGICLLYALSDEIHQSFVAGRTFQATDLVMDTLGTALGIGAFYLGRWVIGRLPARRAGARTQTAAKS